MICSRTCRSGSSSPSWLSSTMYSTPMRRPASWASARRLDASAPPPCVWCPASPLVTETKRTRWPAAAHLAAVPPARMSQSSGCAPKAMMFRGGAAPAVCAGAGCWLDWPACTPAPNTVPARTSDAMVVRRRGTLVIQSPSWRSPARSVRGGAVRCILEQSGGPGSEIDDAAAGVSLARRAGRQRADVAEDRPGDRLALRGVGPPVHHGH